jgi:hypothetical protein
MCPHTVPNGLVVLRLTCHPRSGRQDGARLTMRRTAREWWRGLQTSNGWPDGEFSHRWRIHYEEEDDEEGGDERPAVVIQNGSQHTKAGMSGEDAPRVTFSTVVGYTKPITYVGNQKDYYIGYEAQQKRDLLPLQYPRAHGAVQNWDDMEKVWRHTFDNELRMVVGDDNEHDEDVSGVLLTESATASRDERERTTEATVASPL